MAVREDTVEYFKAANGEWMWHLVAPNGNILCGPTESFSSKAKCVGNYRRSVKGLSSPHKVITKK